jgi:TonB family protein
MRAYLRIVLILSVSTSGVYAQYPRGGGGVDAQGVRHTWGGNAVKQRSMIVDIVRREWPDYPSEARRWRLEGAGLFRLQIDLATGKVTKVTVLKSTGVLILDNSALSALRRWQFKPGTWKEAEMPISFSRSPPRPSRIEP